MATSQNGQEQQKTAQEKELEKLLSIAKTKKDIAEAQKAAAIAQRDLYKAPTEITPVNGKVTNSGTTGEFIENRILAHETLSNTMIKLITSIAESEIGKTKESITLVMYNASDISNLELYIKIGEQLKTLENKFSKVNEAAAKLVTGSFAPTTGRESMVPDPLLVGYAASGILRTAADIASLFRTSVDYKVIDITEDEVAQVAALLKAIKKQNKPWTVYYPSLFPINIIKNSSTESSFITSLNNLQIKNDLANELLAKIEQRKKDSQEQLDKETDEEKKKNIQKDIEIFSTVTSQLNAVKASFSALQTYLSSTDDQTKLPVQASITHAERLAAKLNENGVYTMKLSIISKGSNRTEESIWHSARISFSGGTELNCLIFGPDGKIVFAESNVYYTPYKTPNEILKI